ATVASWSNWCSKVTPLLTVLSSPPPPVPTHHVDGSFSLTVIAVIRPPMLAGPMLRHWKALIQFSGTADVDRFAGPAEGEAGCWAGSWAIADPPANARANIGRTRIEPLTARQSLFMASSSIRWRNVGPPDQTVLWAHRLRARLPGREMNGAACMIMPW